MNGTTPARCTRNRRSLSVLFPRMASVIAALALWCGAAFGQAQNDPMKVQRGAQGAGPAAPVIQQQQQPFYVQAAVVVLLSGGAVWTVCRSSRRQSGSRSTWAAGNTSHSNRSRFQERVGGQVDFQ